MWISKIKKELRDAAGSWETGREREREGGRNVKLFARRNLVTRLCPNLNKSVSYNEGEIIWEQRKEVSTHFSCKTRRRSFLIKAENILRSDNWDAVFDSIALRMKKFHDYFLSKVTHKKPQFKHVGFVSRQLLSFCKKFFFHSSRGNGTIRHISNVNDKIFVFLPSNFELPLSLAKY